MIEPHDPITHLVGLAATDGTLPGATLFTPNITLTSMDYSPPVNRPLTAGAHQRWPMGHRRKRVAGLIALPIAITASAVQIEFLKTELLEVKDNVNRLFEVLQKFDK